MSFYILYIEDNPKHYSKLDKAISEYNEKDHRSSEKIELAWARNLDELKNKLNHQIDIVLADMYLEPGPGDKGNRLREVIADVKEWCENNGVGRTIPIIAYTVDGSDAFKNRKYLYDIWDKNTASVDYVTWRLSELSKEVTRMRPDALMQRLIRTDVDESPQVNWHKHVIDMVERYDKGWTEADQIEGAGKAIENIANQLDSWEPISGMWNVVKNWEFLGRAVSERVRGHARHAINVFWLGYYLIHHKYLREYFSKRWKDIIDERLGIVTLRSVANLGP